jgi:hypothetical protein
MQDLRGGLAKEKKNEKRKKEEKYKEEALNSIGKGNREKI